MFIIYLKIVIVEVVKKEIPILDLLIFRLKSVN
jgi:hypothetical protein